MAFLIILGIFVLILIVGMIFAATSYGRLMRAYNKYDNAFTYTNLTGLEFAQYAIPKLNLRTKISFTEKTLGDYYSPKKDMVVLSNRSAQNRSIASVCITAHELGHAVQKNRKTKLYLLHTSVFFMTKVAKYLFFPILIAGIVLLFFEQYFDIGKIIILLALGSLVFSFLLKVITIPVEYNASKIAYNFLKENHIFDVGELKAAKKMLNVAAETYIASLFVGLLKMFRSLGRSFRR